MRIQWFQHVNFEGLGEIERWVEDRGHTLLRTALFEGKAPLPAGDFDALIVMGGPMGVADTAEHPWLVPEKQAIFRALADKKPILGICLGAQLLAETLGARVFRADHPEIGWFPVEVAENVQKTCGFSGPLIPLHWHGDTFDLPDGAEKLFSTENCPNQGFLLNTNVLGLQFHLECNEDSLVDLVQNAQDDIDDGPFEQSPGRILETRKYFEANHRLLFCLLDRIFSSQGL